LYQQALSGEAVVFDTLLSTSCIHNCINCQSICLELSIYPIFDESGDVIQIIFEGEDILERKKAEDLQKNYQSELESQVEQRTSDLTKKAEELERATKLKSEFLANMSHELRTPMNSIIGFTGRVIKKSADKLDERQLKNLQTVERNAHDLLALINGLLDLSKIEVGRMDVYAEPFDFSVLIQEVVSLVSPLVNDKDVELKLELENSDIQLHTDYTKLKQILINLLSNAIKFTESGSITVTAKLQELPSEAETHLVLNVIDTGEGMSDAALAYVFEPFRQVDGASTRKVGGTGLGLAIVRDFCKLLQGSITVSSQLGEGTNVELTIPIKLDIDDEVIFDEQLISPDNTLSKTILCIDDEVEALELLSGYLIEEGHHVVTASSSEHGLALAKQIKPFVITLDIMMPHKDGWSILSELKASEELRDIPVIIISFMENKAVGYKLGAFDFMQKPVNPKRLMASIQRVVPEDVNRIMVIDDDHDARELITQILVDTNIVVETAVDGNDALRTLESIKSELPELILLDLMMPDMDGFEFLQKMQDNPLWANIPVIIVTAKTLEEHERDFLQPRVNSILAKQGLAPEELLKQLLDDINVLDTKVSI
ncbi:MAG: response regulator, partial [Proteobacteria bacterium]|nr:response regulator [Pseudomonadota bacterium]